MERLLWISIVALLAASAAQTVPACGGLCAIKPEEGGCACHSNCTCLAGRLPGQPPSSLPSPSTTISEAGGQCGPKHSSRCMSGQCCSVAGNYCGVTVEHCVETKCLAGWGNCGPEFVTSAGAVSAEEANKKPDATTKVATPGGACGPSNNARCPGSQCCSVHGFCGVTTEHCSPGKCTVGWGWCDGEVYTTSTSKAPGLTPDRIAIVVGTTLGGVSALVAICYTAWKWHLKRKALKANSFFSSRCSNQPSHQGSSTSGCNFTSSTADHSWPRVKSLGSHSGPSQSSQSNLLDVSHKDQHRKGRQPQGDMLA